MLEKERGWRRKRGWGKVQVAVQVEKSGTGQVAAQVKKSGTGQVAAGNRLVVSTGSQRSEHVYKGTVCLQCEKVETG